MADFYELLGVERDCDQATLRAAYLRQAERYHPDRPSEQGGVDRFKQLRWAYEVLSDPDARADYNLRPERWANYRTIVPTESPPPGPASPSLPPRPLRMQAVALARRVAARRPRLTAHRVRHRTTQVAWVALFAVSAISLSELLRPSSSELNSDPTSVGYDGPRLRDSQLERSDSSSEPHATTADAMPPQPSPHGPPRPFPRPAPDGAPSNGTRDQGQPVVAQGQRPKKSTPPQHAKSFNPIDGPPSLPHKMAQDDFPWQPLAIPPAGRPRPVPWSPPDWQPSPAPFAIPEPDLPEPSFEPLMATERRPMEFPPSEPPFLPTPTAPWLPGKQFVPTADVLPERNHRPSFRHELGPIKP